MMATVPAMNQYMYTTLSESDMASVSEHMATQVSYGYQLVNGQVTIDGGDTTHHFWWSAPVLTTDS